jgi:hypothetical protein
VSNYLSFSPATRILGDEADAFLQTRRDVSGSAWGMLIEIRKEQGKVTLCAPRIADDHAL